MENLKQLYQKRFDNEIVFRQKMWKILCNNFFQKYIPKTSIVLDIACGYCEFLNNINAKKKIGIDLNPDSKLYANSDVEIINGETNNMQSITEENIDVVFVSNFFEHITKEKIIETIKEIRRVLKKNGRLLILQPNIRYCYKDYWMFFDHITPIDDRALIEVLEINGFKIIECKSKFLPFTTKSRYPKLFFLLKVYLSIPILHKIFGQQSFIYAEKI